MNLLVVLASRESMWKRSCLTRPVLSHSLRAMNPELDSEDDYFEDDVRPAQDLVYKQTVIVLWNATRTSFAL